jgi:hypothetical protein
MKRYLDIQFALFVLLALGASVLSSHGAFQFFQYLVSPALAWVFILVVALGIIGLDAAGTISRGAARWAYYGGMVFFLVLETLANYFAGQAEFVSKIVAKLPLSSDLRTIAEHQPMTTRALVVIFLSMASLAVAYFTFAATMRFQQLRNVFKVEQDLNNALSVAEQRASHAEQRAALAEQNVSSYEQRLNTERAALEQQLKQLRADLNSRPPAMTVEVIRLARYELTWEQAEQLAQMIVSKQSTSLSSVRRYVAQVAQPVTAIDQEV